MHFWWGFVKEVADLEGRHELGRHPVEEEQDAGAEDEGEWRREWRQALIVKTENGPTGPLSDAKPGGAGGIRTLYLLTASYTPLVPAGDTASRFVSGNAHLHTIWCRPVTSLQTELVSKMLANAKGAEYSARRPHAAEKPQLPASEDMT